MNKKHYTAPTANKVEVRVLSHLLGASVGGATLSGDFSQELEVGGTTTSSDSRRGSIWDDEY